MMETLGLAPAAAAAQRADEARAAAERAAERAAAARAEMESAFAAELPPSVPMEPPLASPAPTPNTARGGRGAACGGSSPSAASYAAGPSGMSKPRVPALETRRPAAGSGRPGAPPARAATDSKGLQAAQALYGAQSAAGGGRRTMSARTASSATGRRIGVDPLLGNGYQTISPIAQGAFSMITRAKHLATQCEVAIKTYNKAKYFLPGNQHLATALKNELDVLRKLQPTAHPHIANILEVVESKTNIIAVLEYCSGGSLQRCLQKAGGCDRPHSTGLSEPKAVAIAAQLVSALAHIHSVGIAHRDIKPENVLFSDLSQTQVKLCDFGFAIACGNRRVRTVCGSPQYMAPELVSRTREAYFGWAVDMWAFGALVYELLEGKPAFRGNSMEQLNMRILRASHEAFTAATPPAARNLIKSLVQLEGPSRRLARDAMMHDWFAGQQMPAPPPKKRPSSAVEVEVE